MAYCHTDALATHSLKRDPHPPRLSTMRNTAGFLIARWSRSVSSLGSGSRNCPREDGDAMAICRLCGDTCDLGEDWCTSCLLDVEAEIDEMLDAPTPGVD